MTEIRFYHLTRTNLDRALPDLLEKTLARGWRAVVRAGSDERAEWLTRHLWTHDDRGFLPHGNADDGHADRQPIWLTSRDERPNGAEILFLVDGADSAMLDDYQRVCLMFDGRADEAVQAARAMWKRWRDCGHALAYWQQSEQGSWQQTASTDKPSE